MLYLAIKALISGVIIAAVSEIAKRNAGFAALVASLPLVSVLGMIWLWRDTSDPSRLAAHSTATFWFVLPSLPMFLVIPALLGRGMPFWGALGIGCAVTIAISTVISAFNSLTLAPAHRHARGHRRALVIGTQSLAGVELSFVDQPTRAQPAERAFGQIDRHGSLRPAH